MNHRSTTTYIRRLLSGQSPVAESEFLSGEDSARERFVFGLRRLEGVNVQIFQAETGFAISDLFPEAIARFSELGFLQADGGRIRLTREGLLISDSLWPHFLVA